METLRPIRNYLPLTDELATAGQPSAEQFELLAEADFELVVNLAPPGSEHAVENEAGIVRRLGMGYIHIPVEWEAPQLEDLERFFAVMEDHAGRRLFVHCVYNLRVSVFLYLYRVLCLGVPNGEARADLESIWNPTEAWPEFIDTALRRYGGA